MVNTKILSLENWSSYKGSKDKIVLVGGCFDIFHYGHLHFLRESRSMGTSLVIMLESDEFIRTRKHHEPYHSQQQRAEILAELTCVSTVLLLPLLTTDDQYADVVRMIRPHTIAVTEGDSFVSHKHAYATEIGAHVQVVPLLAQFSTTHVKGNATITND